MSVGKIFWPTHLLKVDGDRSLDSGRAGSFIGPALLTINSVENVPPELRNLSFFNKFGSLKLDRGYLQKTGGIKNRVHYS